MKIQKRTIALCIYFGLLILPIYWMLNMSLRTNADILANFALYPADITFKNYIKIFTAIGATVQKKQRNRNIHLQHCSY